MVSFTSSEVVSGAILGEEEDARNGLVNFYQPLLAGGSDQIGTGGRGAGREWNARLHELLGLAEGDGLFARGNARVGVLGMGHT